MCHPKPVAALATCLMFLALCLVSATVLAACSGSGDANGSADAAPADVATAPAKNSKLKTITIGYESYPPSCYLDEDGNPAGIDMDLATEALRRIGYKPVFKAITWTDKDELLAAGKIDCIWCCFSMNGRADRYTWAGPYMKSDEVAVVSTKSDVRTLSDLDGRAIGVAATTEPERILLNHLNPALDAPGRVYSLQDSAYLFTSLGKGYVDAIITHRLMVEQYERDYDVAYRILDEPLVTSSVGVAFARDTTSPVPAELDRVFKKMRRDGSLKHILARYVDDAEAYLPDADEIGAAGTAVGNGDATAGTASTAGDSAAATEASDA